MSPTEVHASVKRAEACRLLHGTKLENRPNLAPIEEFLLHGLKYVFPADHGELTRGVPTSFGAEPLRSLLATPKEAVPVWPYPEGKRRGFALTPLYKAAPTAALRDAAFYEYLVLVDALRDGRVRERKIAQDEFRRKLKEAYASAKR